MAIWEDWGRKVTEASQKTIRKTKDFADIAKLNSIIAEEEKNIEKLYARIGKLYVSTFAGSYDTMFAGIIHEIDASKIKIQECKTQSAALRGVQQCRSCGAEVAVGSAFCNVCGASLITSTISVSSRTNVVVCKHCGAVLEPGNKFCTKCGQKLEINQPVQDDIIQETTAMPENTMICPSCGSEIQKGMKFCTVCGCKLDEIPATVTSNIAVSVTEVPTTGTPDIADPVTEAIVDMEAGEAEIKDDAIGEEAAAETVEAAERKSTAEEEDIGDMAFDAETVGQEECPEQKTEKETFTQGEMEQEIHFDEAVEETVAESGGGENTPAAETTPEHLGYIGADNAVKKEETRKCENCGAPLHEGDVFCMICGTKIGSRPVTAAPVSSIRQCPKCGYQVDEDDVFCVRCGSKL